MSKPKSYGLEHSSNSGNNVLDQMDDALRGVGQSADDLPSQVCSHLTKSRLSR